MSTPRQERISRELRDYRTSISRLNRNHTLPDQILGERLMDIQIGVVATYLDAARFNLLLPIIDYSAGNPRGIELLPLWQHLQEKAHESGYGPDPNRLSDAAHPVVGKGYNIHLASFRRWIPSAIATVDYLLAQMKASGSKAFLVRQLAERIRALKLQYEKSPHYDPRADFLVDYESDSTSPILMHGVGRLLSAAYKAKAFDLPAFDGFHTPSITEAALTGDTSEMTRQMIAWLEYRGHKVSGADPRRNPFDRLADALLSFLHHPAKKKRRRTSIGRPTVPVNSAPFIASPFQSSILETLKNKAMRTDALAGKLGDRRKFFREKKELQERGLICHHRKIGFYRPDFLPPDYADSLAPK